ncbi:MAG: hypothetical protein NTV86_19310 [Planctomycetota bacterium]|nr:hypothetical protein [Planctomycetota bacterium]
MANRRVWFPPLLFLPLCLLGCDPDDMPAYTPDGKTVIAMAHDAKGENVLWTCDVATGTTKAHRVGDGWNIRQARAFGGQVWVDCWQRVKEGESKWSTWRFDPAKNAILPGLADLARLDGAIPVGLDGGKHVVFGSPGHYVAYLFPEMKERKPLDLRPDVRLMAAGGFWSLRVHNKPAELAATKESVEVERIDVFSPAGKQVCSISRTEADKVGEWEASHQGRPAYAHVSKEGDVLLLAFGEQDRYGFGLFDTGSGKFLWGGESGPCVRGTPLVKRTEVWMIEQRGGKADAAKATTMPAMKKEVGIAMIRYAPPAGTDAKPPVGEVVLEYPLDIDFNTDQFALSPDNSHFVLVTVWRPHLLFIPIRQGATAKDVRVVELKEK